MHSNALMMLYILRLIQQREKVDSSLVRRSTGHAILRRGTDRECWTPIDARIYSIVGRTVLPNLRRLQRLPALQDADHWNGESVRRMSDWSIFL